MKALVNVVLLSILTLAASGCAHHPAVESREPAALGYLDDDLKWGYAKPRLEYLKLMKVWTGGTLDEQLARIQALKPAEIIAGPQIPQGFASESVLECRLFLRRIGGMTPKFLCDDKPYAADGGHEFPVKVKYGPFNQEIPCSIGATRLYWMLGFPANPYWHASKVLCHGCPADPWQHRAEDLGPDRVTTFMGPAVETRKMGKRMQEYLDQGWNFDELRVFVGSGEQPPPGTSRAERDALMLLTAFTQGRDNKAANNTMFCTKWTEKNEAGLRDCEEVVGAMTDLGITFGGEGIPSYKRKGYIARLGLFAPMIGARLAEWRHNKVWRKNRDDCTARLWESGIDKDFGHNVGLSNPKISEEGREFLARLLSALSDEQIAALFEAAHVTDVDTGTKIEEWVSVFKDKVEQISSARCWSAAELDRRKPFKPSKNMLRRPHVMGG